ncbi:MAG: phenylalanine--tRNA ligase subunit beta [Chitinophagaceae bacterium]|nr:phenylalanine--tRNA ligase subunit beta [Chitinophagaceae bacterium]
MTISYNWLSEYLPESIEPEKLSKILTSIGLEVESVEKYEEIKGGLQGLIIGKVLACEKHPDADKLKLTQVDIGTPEPLNIVCGAPNVALGQNVIVATIGTTIYPVDGEPVTMKKAKIRGVESQGMICGEDEIGIGKSHDGIIVLPEGVKAGTPAAEYFNPYQDYTFEIGLTPNRMDAMSHIGVAKDVCAYLSHHHKKDTAVKSPFKNNLKADNNNLKINVVIENADSCQRYAGISIQGVTVEESPVWLQQKLKSIGLRPINNIVDITNFILHETGQPLHAFDADKIKGNTIIIKNIAAGTNFITLDEKERKLSSDDLMICDAENPLCIAGIFGGMISGVTTDTKNIFLESAWFNPVSIRKTSVRHTLRTDAAVRFEKGVDISNVVNVLKRAAILIKETAGGQIASDIIDLYPAPKEKTEVALKYHYLKKLSGKNYHGDTIKNILSSLGFELIKEGRDEMWVKVPFNKPDISIPADIVEEIMRIDGLDNIEIPSLISIAPSIETLATETINKEKIANYLVGLGFNEIFTNSITNSAYFNEEVLQSAVKMMNNLSADLDILRPSMLETGFSTVAYNLNRKNNQIQLFEFGKIYKTLQEGKYQEENQLCLYVSGDKTTKSWNKKNEKTDIYYVKGICERILSLLGLTTFNYLPETSADFDQYLVVKIKNEEVAKIGAVNKKTADRFECKQPVFYLNIHWDKLLLLNKKYNLQFKEISKYPSAQRDLSVVVDKSIRYKQIEKATSMAKINKLASINLFDIFESEKLGASKKSMAINYTFVDEEKTLTDKDIDTMMAKIIATYEKELSAEIRK